MASVSVDELKNLRWRYVNLKRDAQAVLLHLNTCKQMSSTLDSSLLSSFTVNEETIDNNNVSKIGNNIENMKNKLNNLVIPSLTSKIAEIDRLITEAEVTQAEA